MDNVMFWSIAKRFARVFVSGAVVNMGVFVAGTSPDSLTDWKVWSIALGLAALTGGLNALDKYLRWQE
jgi:hypothetical protein